MDFANFVSVCSQIVVGFKWTIIIFFVTLMFSMPLGLLVARCRMSGIGIVKRLTQVIISILRGTPLMLQLIVVFYGPYFVFGMTLSSSWRMLAVMIGFSINYSAYFGEIFRAGFEAVPPGQLEAGYCVGMSYTQTIARIVLPQALRVAFPSLFNSLISLVKDTSLASNITVTEMMMQTRMINAKVYEALTLYLEVALIYLMFSTILTYIQRWGEKKLSSYEKR